MRKPGGAAASARLDDVVVLIPADSVGARSRYLTTPSVVHTCEVLTPWTTASLDASSRKSACTAGISKP